MSKIIAVANQKGGVAKTTTSINLAAALGLADWEVLLIDLDPQGNATMGSGVDKHQAKLTCNDILLGNCDIHQALKKTNSCYDLIPGNSDLTEAEVKLINMLHREFQLKQALNHVASRYQYVLIDCPPSLNMLTLNALVAADSVLVPVQCEYYALEGLTSLMETVTQLQSTVNPKLEVEGFLRTMYDSRNRLATEVSEQLIKHFGNRVYETVIPRNVRLAEAPSYGVPGIMYDRQSAGAQAYHDLAKEIIQVDELAFKQESTEDKLQLAE